MNQPALYHKSHRANKADVGQIFKEYSSKFNWRCDGSDTLIDVGSGPGDVLMDYIVPLMPVNFHRLVCSDISKDMIDFAKSYYRTSSDHRCEFKVLDIAMKCILPADLLGQFDHVTSMLCLHWVQDQRTALRNIFNLLRPEGGDCLLVFMSSHTIFDVYDYTSRFTKWSEYMKDVNRFISQLHYSHDPKGEFKHLLEEAGFRNVIVDVKPKAYSYGNVENFKESIKSVCGVLDNIPISCHSEFLNDFTAVMSKYAARSDDLNGLNSQCTVKYDLMVAYGQKLPERNDGKSYRENLKRQPFRLRRKRGSTTYYDITREPFIRIGSENLTSVCGILDLIPKSLQSEFLDDYVQAFVNYVAQRSGLNLENSKCIILADLVVAYGQRPPMKNESKCNK